MSPSSFTIDHINNIIISVICGLHDRPEVAASPFRRPSSTCQIFEWNIAVTCGAKRDPRVGVEFGGRGRERGGESLASWGEDSVKSGATLEGISGYSGCPSLPLPSTTSTTP